jgi:hypothetical protein
MPGSITFEWLEGGHFIVRRSHNEHELFPDAICLIGAPEVGEGLVIGVLRLAGRAPGVRHREGDLPPSKLSGWLEVFLSHSR